MPAHICRVCFEEGTDLKVLGTGQYSTGYKLSSCVPEINVYIVENPTICRPCLCMVEVAYKLRETCLENEKRFNQNFDRNDFVFSKKIPQVKKEIHAAQDRHENKDVSVVFNDFFDESGMMNIDSKEIMRARADDGNLPIKTEVFDNLLEVTEEYVTTESNVNFVSRINSEGVHEYSCNMCDRSFSGVRGLKSHLNKAHYKTGIAKSKFECDICYRTFMTRAALAMHSKSCKKIKYRIGNSFTQQQTDPLNSSAENNNMQIDQNVSSSVKLSIQSETFTCEKCLKIFTTRASFRVHSKHCTEELLDEEKMKIDVSALTINPHAVSESLQANAAAAATKPNNDDADSHSDNYVDSDDDPTYKSSSESVDLDSDGSDYSISNRRKRKSKGRNSWGFRSFFGDQTYKRKRVDLQIKCDNCERTFTTRAAYTVHSRSCVKLKLMLGEISQANENQEAAAENNETVVGPEFVSVQFGETANVIDQAGECLCKICGEVLPDQLSLEDHVTKHIGASSKDFPVMARAQDDEITVCCGKEYTTVSLLQLHTYKEHGKSCGVCTKHYTSYNELFAHLLEHTKE